MNTIRIDDCRIEIWDNIVNVFRDNEDKPFKTLNLTGKCLDEFIKACKCVYVRAKIPVSMAIEKMAA
jgi:hypothetical protein